ncbi:AAA family ATPase [Streptomyces sp. NPDC090075]|uniref:AAA family ATPase n=1 Tax=Streptomyces sp. NPDC090075 TaxID=3365937 RepID=UPI00382B133C
MAPPRPNRWFVRNVNVRGLAGREKTFECNLNPDVNVFFGRNGSGKTTLLRIIHSALSGDALPLFGSPFESAKVEIWFPAEHRRVVKSFTMPSDEESETIRKDPAFRRHIERMPLSQRRKYFPQGALWETIHDTSSRPRAPRSFPHRYLPTSRIMDELSSPDSPRELSREWSMDEYFADSIQRLWSHYSTEVLGAVRKAQEDGLARILQGVISPAQTGSGDSLTFDPDTAFWRVDRFLRRQGSPHLIQDKDTFDIRFASEPAFKRVVLEINEVEEKIEFALLPRTKLATLVSRLISGPKQISFENSQIRALAKGSKEISLDRLSSGEKQLIRILVEVLSASGHPLIIDEPELSMHVDWQLVLVESIQTIDDSTQVIAATHSPEIMANISDEKIFRL